MGNIGSVSLIRGVNTNNTPFTLRGETGIDSIALTQIVGTVGFSIGSDGWNPARAAPKADGFWADSITQDGRQLLSASVGNVNETFRMTLSAGDWTTYNRYLSKLEDFLRTGRSYSVDFWEVQPVYLAWKPPGASREQYALVYNGSVQDIHHSGTDPQADVTLILEREPYWRVGTPPHAGIGDLIKSEFVVSKTEYALASPEEDTYREPLSENYGASPANIGTIRNKNFIDLDIDDIKGDAPAILNVVAESDGATRIVEENSTIYVATTSRKPTMTQVSNTKDFRRVAQLNACDGILTALVPGTGSIATDASNGLVQGTDAANTRKYVSVQAGTYRISWRQTNLSPGGDSLRSLQANLWLGRYNVYVRALTPSGGSANLRMSIEDIATGEAFLTPTDVFANNLTTGVYWHFVGTTTVPFNGKVKYGVNGIRDVYNPANKRSLEIRLDVEYVSGLEYGVYDIQFVPYEKDLIEATNFATVTSSDVVILNSEAYPLRLEGPNVTQIDSAGDLVNTIINTKGNNLYLEPNTYNRLYWFLRTINVRSINPTNSTDELAPVKLNMYAIPRVVGPADF